MFIFQQGDARSITEVVVDVKHIERELLCVYRPPCIRTSGEVKGSSPVSGGSRRPVLVVMDV